MRRRQGCPASCLVMAGGRGERFGGPVKPLADVCGEPMIVRVARALVESGVCPLVAIAYSRRTSRILSLDWEDLASGIVFVETPGLDYPRDLREALRRLPQPTLVVPADMPYLTPGLVARIAGILCEKPWGVVNLKGPHGLTGVSLHRSWRGSETWGEASVAEVPEWMLIDVDTPDDLEEARAHCGGTAAAHHRGRSTSAPP